MPTPTAVLDEDIKELRASNEKILATLSDMRVEAARNHAELATEVRNLKGIGKWILAVVLAVLTGIGGAIWWASKVDSRLGQVEQKVEGPRR